MEPTRRVKVQRVNGAAVDHDQDDVVAVEEPLEIRLAGEPVAVVMRTPGHDAELAAGFLLTEGVLPDAASLGAVAHCKDSEDRLVQNVVNVLPAGGAAIARPRARRFDATASCGLCGKDRIEDIRVRCTKVAPGFVIGGELIVRALPLLSAAQSVFHQTGGLHGAALFDAAGRMIAAREDIGRHNAVDKLIGGAVMREDLPLSSHVLMVSGRVGFEIAQKAAVAGIPVLAGVSAPTSLAIDLAEELGVTLIAFLRGSRFNIYTHPHRIA